MEVIIVSPSLDASENVSGISSVVNFILDKNKDINYIHFELGKKDKEKGGIYRLIRTIVRLYKWVIFLFRNRGDIIHYNFPLSKLSIIRDSIFILMAYLCKRKVIIHLHGGSFLMNKATPLIINKILNIIFSLGYPVIVLGAKEEIVIKEKFPIEKVHVLPNCISLDSASLFRREINTNRVLNIVYLGRIAESKGINFIFAACKELNKKGVLFKLIFAGEEEYKNQFIPLFQTTFSNEFVYKGVVYGEKKETMLCEADIFLLPSFYEGLPVSLLECMSMGVVPVITNVGSVDFCVTHMKNGIFIKDHDTSDIVSAIELLNKDRNLLYSMSLNAEETIRTKFDPNIYVSELNLIYQSCLN